MFEFGKGRRARFDIHDDVYAFQVASMSLSLSSPFSPAIGGAADNATSHYNNIEHAETIQDSRQHLQGDAKVAPGAAVSSPATLRLTSLGRESLGHGRDELLRKLESLTRKQRRATGITNPATDKRNARIAVVAAASADASRGSVRSFVSDLLRGRTKLVPLVLLGLCLFTGYRRNKKSSRAGGNSGITELDEFGNSLVATDRQKRVLILMSDTGGGHRASAEAIKQAIAEEFGESYKVTVIDLWKEHTPWPFNQMPKSYSFLVKHETLWKVAFHVTKPRFVHQPQMAATSAFVAREVAKGLNKYQPDVIVSVHPLMQHIPIRVLRSKGLLHKIPFTTVITDLTTCHPTWFHKLATICFCPTKDVAQRAFKAGLKASQIKVHGLPIRPSFCKPVAPKEELRREMGMDPELPAVLLMGGGEGMGPVEATARALARSLGGASPKGQLIIICGRNKKLFGKLQAVDWPLPVQVKGFVTNMPEWMAACDCVISKAGPGTIAESMIRGLPMILNDYIAGQEVGNVPFVVENGAGKFSEDPREIAKIVADWFGPNIGELREMSANALKLARPDAVFRIVRDLDRLIRQRDVLPQGELALTSE